MHISVLAVSLICNFNTLQNFTGVINDLGALGRNNEIKRSHERKYVNDSHYQ